MKERNSGSLKDPPNHLDDPRQGWIWLDPVSADKDSVSDFRHLFSQLRQGWWFAMTYSAHFAPASPADPSLESGCHP